MIRRAGLAGTRHAGGSNVVYAWGAQGWFETTDSVAAHAMVEASASRKFGANIVLKHPLGRSRGWDMARAIGQVCRRHGCEALLDILDPQTPAATFGEADLSLERGRAARMCPIQKAMQGSTEALSPKTRSEGQQVAPLDISHARKARGEIQAAFGPDCTSAQILERAA